MYLPHFPSLPLSFIRYISPSNWKQSSLPWTFSYPPIPCTYQDSYVSPHWWCINMSSVSFLKNYNTFLHHIDPFQYISSSWSDRATVYGSPSGKVVNMYWFWVQWCEWSEQCNIPYDGGSWYEPGLGSVWIISPSSHHGYFLLCPPVLSSPLPLLLLVPIPRSIMMS